MTDTLHQAQEAGAIAPDRQLVVVENDDAESDCSSEENWRDDPCIVCAEQPALKVYANPYGQAVIRQQRQWDQDCDPIVYVSREYAVTVAHAILAAVGMGDIEFVQPSGGGGGFNDVEIPAPAGTRFEREQHNERKPKRSRKPNGQAELAIGGESR
jgi:hypothetical protein